MRSRLLAVLSLAVVIPAALVAEDWPQWRGPAGTGLTNESRLPTEWSADKNVAWKVKIPGYAWSQPIVWGDKVFVTTAVSDKQQRPAAGMGGGRGGPGGGLPGGRPPGGGAPGASGPGGGGQPGASRPGGGFPGGQPPGGGRGMGGGMGTGGPPPDAVYRWEVHCLDRNTGKTLWSSVAIERKPTIPIHRTNTYASETPVTDGERVYVYFGMTGLFCFDLEGKKIWSKEIGAYPMMAGWGTGSSPVLAGDKLILQCDNERESFIVAFDKATGKEAWRKPREEKSTWSTPFVWKNKQRTELVTAGSRKIISYDPADGKVIWEIGRVTGRCSATPVGDDDMLYLGTGGGPQGNGPLFAIRAGAKGDITLKEGENANDFIAWRVNRGGPPMASPLLYHGRLYIAEQNGGVVTCFDAASGKQLWKERLPGARGFTSSPWAYGGKVYILDDNAVTHVLEAGPEFKVVSKNALNEQCWSSPALAGGAIYLRTVDHLWCIRN
jgi:outer membrane protein assembly factor BamB